MNIENLEAVIANSS